MCVICTERVYIFLLSREHAVYSCPNEGCNEGSTPATSYISMHVAGASEAATVGREWTCYKCGTQLVEDVSCRTLSGREHNHVHETCL